VGHKQGHGWLAVEPGTIIRGIIYREVRSSGEEGRLR